MWAYFFLIAMLLIIVVSAVYGLVLSKKKPAYISENKDGTVSGTSLSNSLMCSRHWSVFFCGCFLMLFGLIGRFWKHRSV